MFTRLLSSVSLTLLVSSVLAWPFTFLHVNFLSALGFFVALQFVCFYFYRDYTEKKLALEEARLIVEREAELSKQGSTVTCPCDRGVKCFVPVLLNERNEYNCPGCNKTINVLVKLKTALSTIPVSTDPQAILQQVEDAGGEV